MILEKEYLKHVSFIPSSIGQGTDNAVHKLLPFYDYACA